MARQMFVNLPVRDLERSVTFFKALGFAFDPKFSDEKAACLVVADNIFVMLLVDFFFSTFTKKELCDATRSTEAIVCISCDSREQVDELVAKALSAGGTIPRRPEDHDFMYCHGFEDPDGHIWEFVWMNPEANVASTSAAAQ